jgi:hypothetical protein
MVNYTNYTTCCCWIRTQQGVDENGAASQNAAEQVGRDKRSDEFFDVLNHEPQACCRVETKMWQHPTMQQSRWAGTSGRVT